MKVAYVSCDNTDNLEDTLRFRIVLERKKLAGAFAP